MTTENPYTSPQDEQDLVSRPRKEQADAEPWPEWATRDTVFPRHLAALVDNLASIAL